MRTAQSETQKVEPDCGGPAARTARDADLDSTARSLARLAARPRCAGTHAVYTCEMTDCPWRETCKQAVSPWLCYP